MSFVDVCRSLYNLVFGGVAASFSAAPAIAAQTINTTSTTSCTAQGGTIAGANLLTDFDNGTFGMGTGAANESPSTDPYLATISGGTFDNFYNFDHGDYGYVSNPVTGVTLFSTLRSPIQSTARRGAFSPPTPTTTHRPSTLRCWV